MAVVLVIIGTLMSAGLKIATSVLSSNTSTVTNQNISIIKQSLINFLRSNGRLPCPDIAVPPTGIEPAACVANNQGYGVIPWTTLGITRDVALDGFSNFITYRVSNVAGIAVPATAGISSALDNRQIWTNRAQANSFSILNIQNTLSPAGNKTIEIQQRDATTGAITPITYNAVVVLYSHGKNGSGALTTKGTTNAAPVGADEVTNNTNGSVTFITKPAVDVTASAGGAYDDVIAYMTPQDLLQPLITEQTLKTCQGYCAIPAALCSPPAPATVPIGRQVAPIIICP
jgi:type II secretory pathway pseudopilin PulG